jgi:hypothetical protein
MRPAERRPADGLNLRLASTNQPLAGRAGAGRVNRSGLSFTSRMGRACCGLADTVDPTAQMKHTRNAELRVHSAVMETSLEIVFTWTGVVLVLWYNVSADGRAVDTATVIANGVVQHPNPKHHPNPNPNPNQASCSTPNPNPNQASCSTPTLTLTRRRAACHRDARRPRRHPPPHRAPGE